MKGLYDTIERIIPDNETKLKVDRQIDQFIKLESEFNRSMATMTRGKKHPSS